MEKNNIVISLIIILGVTYFYLRNRNKSSTITESYIDKHNLSKKHTLPGKFPFPSTTTKSENLSKGREIKVMHNKGYVTEPIEYQKDYLKHDIISPNPQGSTELQHVAGDNGVSWTEENVSQHPKYYRSKFDNELTDVGSFFNKQNNLVDNTSPK